MNTTSTSTSAAAVTLVALGAGLTLWLLHRGRNQHPVGIGDKAGMTQAVEETSRLHERWKQAGSTSP